MHLFYEKSVLQRLGKECSFRANHMHSAIIFIYSPHHLKALQALMRYSLDPGIFILSHSLPFFSTYGSVPDCHQLTMSASSSTPPFAVRYSVPSSPGRIHPLPSPMIDIPVLKLPPALPDARNCNVKCHKDWVNASGGHSSSNVTPLKDHS